MIPSQKPMLIKSAKEFEYAVKSRASGKSASGSSGKKISWDDIDAVKDYVSKLQHAGESLSTKNRQLRQYHQRVCSIVMSLAEVDLLNNQAGWKSGLDALRQLMSDLEKKLVSLTMLICNLTPPYEAAPIQLDP